MQLRSVAAETHAAPPGLEETATAPREKALPGSTSSTSAAGGRCSRSFPRRHPPPVPPRPPHPTPPPSTVGARPPPGLPAQRLPGRGSRLLLPRSGPGACSLPQPGSLCRLLAAASIWPRRTRRGEGGSRRGSAAPGRRPRGGRSGRRRPNLAALAGRCHSASPPPAAARGGVGEARPPGGGSCRVPEGVGDPRSPRRGPGALPGSPLTLSAGSGLEPAGGREESPAAAQENRKLESGLRCFSSGGWKHKFTGPD